MGLQGCLVGPASGPTLACLAERDELAESPVRESIERSVQIAARV